MFAYELPLHLKSPNLSNTSLENFNLSNSIVVYNFHSIMFHERFFFFSVEPTKTSNNFSLNSISELYPNTNWLEREIAELNGIVFVGKKDLRNLMLQYGDTSVPFQKAYPSIGLKEVVYDSVNDLIIQTPITLQV
jgi:NADH:ubiquinone oxidoreductase subunit C